MHDVVLLAVKTVTGGVIVVAFAVLSEVTRPKRFSGLFGAAPAVALAGLLLTTLDRGGHEASRYATGMVAGAVGMLSYCLLSAYLLGRVRVRAATLAGLGLWLATCAALYPAWQ